MANCIAGKNYPISISNEQLAISYFSTQTNRVSDIKPPTLADGSPYPKTNIPFLK